MTRARRWWLGSSLLGLVISASLLTLALRDESVRISTGQNGALSIFSRASVVLKAQFTVYFALCVMAAAVHSTRGRLVSLVVGNLVLTSAALYRLKVRRDMVRWSGRRDRRRTDRLDEVTSKHKPPRNPRNHLA